MIKTKVGYSLLIFILTVFMATSGVVTSPSLYNITAASNNLEKVFATPDSIEEEPEEIDCAEGEEFNEETQTCEPQQTLDNLTCEQDEEFNEQTQTCEPVETGEEKCDDGIDNNKDGSIDEDCPF